jgi:murein DD-endopeptidase MepM/ murein hydrolase activator NlpD
MFCLRYKYNILLFLGLLIVNLGVFLTVKAVSLDNLQEEMQGLQETVTHLEQQSQVYQKNIQKKEKDIQSLSNKIDIFNQRIYKLENDIQLTSRQIELKNLTIQSLSIEIDKTLLDIAEKKKVLAQLLQAINNFDQQSLLEVFFSSDRLSDFFHQTRYLEVIQENLQKSVEEMRSLRKELENHKSNNQQKKKELEELQQRTTVQKYALANERSNKKELLQETQGEEARYQELLQETLRKKGDLLREIAKIEKEIERVKNFLFYQETGNIPSAGTKLFRWPEEDPILTQSYGMTDFARSGAYGGAGHNGIDMSSGLGSPIRAAADGEVLVSGYNNGWGNWMSIKHPNDLVTLYAHMIRPTFKNNGDKIEAGQVIGYEGSTGFSTGSHLHFSVYYKFFTYKKNGQIYFNYFDGTLNPLNYL